MGAINTLDSRYGEGTAARGHVTSVSPRGAKKARPKAAVRRTTPREAIRPDRCGGKKASFEPTLVIEGGVSAGSGSHGGASGGGASGVCMCAV